MLKLSTRTSLAACLLLTLATLATAGGFSIYEAGAKATGMGCAVTASVADGSAMFYNIAGLSFMPGTVADLNVMPVAPTVKFAGIGDPFPSDTAETVDQSFLIPGLGVTHNPGGNWRSAWACRPRSASVWNGTIPTTTRGATPAMTSTLPRCTSRRQSATG